MKQKTILLTATLLILAACSQSEIETEEGATREIKATSVIEGASTRALIGTDAALSDLTFLRVDIDASSNKPTSYDFSSSTPITGSSRATSGGAITFGNGSSPQNYDQESKKNAYFRGFTTENIKTPGTKGTAEWEIKGTNDILMTDVWDAGNYASPINTGMTFKHLLSRIEVVCKAETGSSLDVVKAAWGKVTKIEVLNANPELKYTYSSNTIEASGTPVAFALHKDYTTTDNPTTLEVDIRANDYSGTDVDAVAMIPVIPLTGGSPSYSFQLKVTTAGATTGETQGQPITIDQINVSLSNAGSSNLAMEAGKIHKVVLTFKADGRTISCESSSIEAWDTNGNSGTGEVVKPNQGSGAGA